MPLRARSTTVAAALVAAAFAFASWAAPAWTAPDAVRIPMKAERDKGDPPDAALFSHWEHNRFYCYSCHPSVFPQRRLAFTHDDMDEGRFCGTCHDGKRAFSPDDDDIECETCHRPSAWKGEP
jgi:c(7)-type cytochrome triheme protein